MSRHAFKLPDLGEGTVSAEIVAWRVNVGDLVEEDQPIVEMSTDKAVVEVPSPVRGRVVERNGEPGDTVAVGLELIVFEVGGEGSAAASANGASPAKTANPVAAAASKATLAESKGDAAPATNTASARIMASPATRRRAHEAGIDLSQVRGSGPGGRIEPADLDAVLQGGRAPATATRVAKPAGKIEAGKIEEIKVIGVRRVIAQRMSESKRNIPHFAYVEEVDVTKLESLRQHLNGKLERDEALTYLPFLIAALTQVLKDFPQCNQLYDAERGVLLRHAAVHVGIATQTPDGLKVPVVRDAQSRSLWELAAEIRRVSGAARTNKATREELSGSTITVTSLGKLGGIVSTPIINAPEMAIIGVNRAVERPMVYEGAIAIRLMMNLSSSFDHRFVDGHDAAAMIQALKERLEHPATIFIPESDQP